MLDASIARHIAAGSAHSGQGPAAFDCGEVDMPLSGYARCPDCGNTLGEWIADRFVMRKRGREIVCGDVDSVKCEECGGIYRPAASPVSTPTPTPSPAATAA